MSKDIEKIYKLIYTPIITPWNLLENAKLENYLYVKYYKYEKGLIAEMKCLMENEEVIFKYEFDNKDHLQKIKKDEVYVFNRQTEILNAQNEYFKNKKIGG